MRAAGILLAVCLAVAACNDEPPMQRHDDVANSGGSGGSGSGSGAGPGNGTAGNGGTGGSGGALPTPGPLTLTVVASGFPWLTDLQFLPGDESILVVTDNGGAARWVSLDDGRTGTILDLPAIDETREGLLGLAFHPAFPADRRIFVHYALAGATAGEDVVRISSFALGDGDPVGPAQGEEVLLELAAPLPNHNGGQVAFGPDGYLWASFGDGGTVEAPRATGGDPGTLWGKLVRIDVDRREGGKPYGIPADNPFVTDPAVLPEIWALGLRNPWRFSFDDAGRPIVADVGAASWEEISIVRAGENHGWITMEGTDCFPPGSTCETDGLVPPTFAYAHEDDGGACVTGGFVYGGDRLPALRGLYVFADFERGTIDAVDLERPSHPRRLGTAPGRQLVAFARDAAGELYLGDLASGEILRLDGIDP